MLPRGGADLAVRHAAAWLFSEWFTKPLRSFPAPHSRWPGQLMPCRWYRRTTSWASAGTSTTWPRRSSAASSRKARLLANVSHDLRTPLTLIKGYAETVRDLTGDDDTKRRADEHHCGRDRPPDRAGLQRDGAEQSEERRRKCDALTLTWASCATRCGPLRRHVRPERLAAAVGTAGRGTARSTPTRT